ncbi:MAG: SufD family Fe-S cluster assembly protein, partial [Alphaproteobacteria bacterium]|nr:SufD family Fe-S cluster assembly protein [Alphaproteobacteria bacterium]
IVSYGVAMERSRQTYRSLVSFSPTTTGAKNAQKCDTKIIGDNAIVNTYPVIIHGNSENHQTHEASASAVPADALWYLGSAGISEDMATALIVSGAAAPVLSRLPMEFLVESKQLIQMALENK